MQTLLNLKPLKLCCLIFNTLVSLAITLLSAVFDFVVLGDSLSILHVGIGSILAIFVALLLVWIYDEKTDFARLSVMATENSIHVPGIWFQNKKTILLSQVDKQRTLAYNSENKWWNQIYYTIWLMNGNSVLIGKWLYKRSETNEFLEKVGLSTA